MRLPALLLLPLLTASTAFADGPPNWARMQQAVLFDQNTNTVKALVAEGVNPNDPIGCGTYSPLDGAVGKANVEMLELLLTLGAKPTDRQLVLAAYAADHKAGMKMVELLHSAGAPISATALHAAVWSENLQLVRYLLDQPDVRMGERNVDGYTPLQIALENGNVALSSMLLAAGAKPESVK